MAKPDSSGSRRSSKSSRVTKTMPALGLLTKPLIESPGKATEPETPGSSRATWDILRMTSSVRSRVAP